MSNYNSLKTTIDANIKQNGRQEITGQILNSVLNQMVTTLGAGYQFAGVATTATNPGTPDAKVFYIANGKGRYTNFGGLEVTEDEVVVLYWDSSWHKEATGIASNDKLTELEQKTSELELEDDSIRKLSEQADKKADITLKVVSPIEEDEFVVTDNNGNVVIRYNKNGLDIAKVSPHMISVLDKVKPVVFIEVVEDGFFVVDNSLNIGLCIDGNGTHSNNLVEI